MLIKTRCPACKRIIYPNINLKMPNNQVSLKEIRIDAVVTEEEMVKKMIPELRKTIFDGVEIEKNHKIYARKIFNLSPGVQRVNRSNKNRTGHV